MRKWDEDGEPDADAVEFGEFLLKVTCYSCLLAAGCLCAYDS
jgi:hypothetical protein